MTRIALLLVSLSLTLAACAPLSSGPGIGSDGRGYRLSASDESRVQYRMLDAVNALRADAGLTALELDSRLNAAAATHSRDMAVQNRPWHFGSDGSSPVDRARRVGYSGRILGENISETYETELQTLTAWMQEKATRETIMAREARQMGFAWHQEDSGKIWWTLVTGASGQGGTAIAGL